MYKLAISLLEMDYGHLAESLSEAEAAGIDLIHIDVMDGSFVPGIGIGTRLIQGIRPCTGLTFDVHMMTVEPDRHLERMAQAGADVLTVHYEACGNLKETVARIKGLGVKAGVVLNPETSADVLDDGILRELDVVQLMTTAPGREGQTFIPASLEKIAGLRRRLERLGLATDIEVDGNITLENAGPAAAAGATILVSGRALAQGDAAENIQKMKTAIADWEKGKQL